MAGTKGEFRPVNDVEGGKICVEFEVVFALPTDFFPMQELAFPKYLRSFKWIEGPIGFGIFNRPMPQIGECWLNSLNHLVDHQNPAFGLLQYM